MIKESLEEIEEYEVEQESQESCDPLLNRMLLMEELKDECRKHSYDFLPRDILSKSSPYLYPFIIEYSLIGASVAYIMSNHIGVLADTGEVNKGSIHKHCGQNWMKKKWRNGHKMIRHWLKSGQILSNNIQNGQNLSDVIEKSKKQSK